MDNYFKNCPPLMEDQGRNISDFRSEADRNDHIKYINNIQRDDQYRLFLQTNAKDIMQKEWAYLKTNNACWDNICTHVYPTLGNYKQFIKEREIFESSFDLNNGNNYNKCKTYDDYHLNY